MPTAPQRPRALVIHEVWRELRGVQALSGPQGAPLSRTVKLILDPLVIRPVQHPHCAGPLVTAEGAARLTELIRAAGAVLADTAGWFALFKRVRRLMRITDGHPQDRYFQRCFELATTVGTPDPAAGRATVEEALREMHDASEGRTVEALKAHLADPDRAAELAARLKKSWVARDETPVPGDHDDLLTAVLDAFPSGDPGPGTRRLTAARAGTASGRALWAVRDALGAGPHPARELGLTAHDVPVVPSPGASSSGPAEPFDRTVYQRIFTVLRTSADRAELPPVAELVAAEAVRACEPWALSDETLRVVAAVGVRLALGLRPLETGGETAAHRAVNARWRREAYVLRARRLSLAPEPAAEPLTRVAGELARPWRAYLRRLWARLHGRDVRGLGVHDTELWDLLDGVARSVILDHRDQVRRALSVHETSPAW
ncbi:hypothetical protein [Phytomonospora endophytica]|uniref:Uncharacterized protein n=1 Tax=Phytomonospora endophytica TaxID=714109 RepID=A0A841FGK0_9ACTN|nr:hypothetical protein [Phytomonospora endophytica]MBB6032217.1 hypothetical protein [Phytomonospora endophytica]GIG68566.1 hypothetical protein Pen01_48610 [Phytomonospora endophytica]